MFVFFFFKQKTAYEIYQCDWSSDVCSSDLDVVIDGKTYAKRNEFVTLALQSALAKVAASAKKINFKIKVRSPLTCVAPKGLCQMCYGLNDDGQLPQIGDAVGLNDTEALLERSANLTLKAFHNLGSQANQISISDIDRYKQLIEFPKNLRGKAVKIGRASCRERV